MTDETIDDVKQAYALLFKAHGKLREERDALLDKVRDYGGRMTDEQSSTLAELDEAIAANDLPSVGTKDALLEANQWEMMFGEPDAADMLRALVSERDELASRVAELEIEVLDQCRLNGMGAERESALMGRVREMEGALCQISDMTYDSWTNGAIAKQIADAALSATTPESKP